MIERIHALFSFRTIAESMVVRAYYASPPQIPSSATRIATSTIACGAPASILPPSNIPHADSAMRVSKIPAWIIAGRGKNRTGKGGKWSVSDERDKNTVVWYINFNRNECEGYEGRKAESETHLP